MSDNNQVWPFIMSEERQNKIMNWHLTMNELEEYNRMTGQNIRRLE